MITFARSYKTSTKNFKTIALVECLRRLWITDPMLLAITIGIVGLIGMFCLFAMAAMATLFGADAFGDFLRDAGQQVGGAGGVGAAGAAAAGGAVYGPPLPTDAERIGLPRYYTSPVHYPTEVVRIGGGIYEYRYKDGIRDLRGIYPTASQTAGARG